MEWMMFSSNFAGSDLTGQAMAPVFWMVPLLLWTLVWTGWALWLAARRGEKIWFVAMLVLNTVGILEIVYIFLIAKRSDIPENRHFEHEQQQQKGPFNPPEMGSSD